VARVRRFLRWAMPAGARGNWRMRSANGWLTAEAAPDLVFGAAMDGKWEAALRSIGVHPLMLSSEAGHA
jgi:hypothetical protein